jgi:glycosyltransferase involved in cell wall biosynthesis
MSRISVVITTYNREEYLRESIESVLLQSLSPMEIIVFDNGSRDQTECLVKSFGNQVGYHKEEVNIGPVLAFKKAIEISNGDWVIVFHDDDIMHKNCLKAYDNVISKGVYSWVGSRVSFETNPKLSKKEISGEAIIFNTQEALVSKFWEGMPIGFPTIMYRKDLFNSVFVDLKRYGKYFDRYILCELVRLAPSFCFLEPCISYRIHSGQGSQNKNTNELRHVLNLYKYLIPILKRKLSSYFIYLAMLRQRVIIDLEGSFDLAPYQIFRELKVSRLEIFGSPFCRFVWRVCWKIKK